MQVNFERERKWWDAKAPAEELDLADEFVNRALRWREIDRHLEGVRTILDVGAGTGVFSIPLAQRGFSVTHLDFSMAMLDIARRKAAHVPTIRFVEANAVDLPFQDGSFDMVLNLDGAVSFCGAEAKRAIGESCRVTGDLLILTVSNRANLAGFVVCASLQVSGCLLPAAYAMIQRGEWHQEQYPDNPSLSKGCTQDYSGALKAFSPAELKVIIQEAGMRPLRVGGLGSLAQWCTREVIERVRNDESLLREFLDICEHFDAEVLPDGPGTRQRAGLIAVAKRREARK